jgi:hypothetical protein
MRRPLFSFLVIGSIMATAGCGGERNSSPPFPSTVTVSAVATGCLLDPAVVDHTQVSTDFSDRSVTVREEGKEPVVLLPGESAGRGYAYTNPTLSPDLQTVVVGAALQSADGTVEAGLWQFSVSSDSSQLLFLADQRTFDVDDPAFSPTGSRIAFTKIAYSRNESGSLSQSFEVWVVNSDRSNAVRVIAGRKPMWSSDGRYLSFDTQTAAGPSLGRAYLDAQTLQPIESQSLPDCPSSY